MPLLLRRITPTYATSATHGLTHAMKVERGCYNFKLDYEKRTLANGHTPFRRKEIPYRNMLDIHAERLRHDAQKECVTGELSRTRTR